RSRWNCASPVSAISRILEARSLPMPGISRSPVSSSVTRSCGWLDAMSAALRYARILKGFSSLISSRSAISRRIRATPALSIDQETVSLDAVIEDTGAPGNQRAGNRLVRGRRPVTEQAAAASCAADLRRGGAGALRARNQVVDYWRRDAGRQALPVVPLR